MNWTERRERFRAQIASDKCVHPGSVYDAMSARMAEDLGFEVGMFAGSVASLAVLGAPDHIVLTLSEFADQAYRICRAGNLALLVDADHGYGNALNVMRTVQELETAGVAALSIEDTDLPQPFGQLGKARLLSVEEGVGKMKAALTARQDRNLVIAGRTSAPGMTGVEDTIRRAKAYEAAGVDMIFLVGVKSAADLAAIAGEIRLPIILGSGPKGALDDYAKLGIRIALQTHKPIMAAVRATYDTLKALREGVPADDIEYFASGALMKQVTRDADYERWMKDFLGG
ncbi:MAG: oxaloacetate decarboxylase [Alphaproteobacteria bacterium]